MELTIGIWVLAMLSGLFAPRQVTTVLSCATIIAYIATSRLALAGWEGWLELAALGITPWLLAAQQLKDAQTARWLREQEALRVSKLSEAARSLLTLDRATQDAERQITQITDLYHVTKETSRALHLKALFGACLDMAPRLLNTRGLRLIDLSAEAPRVLRAVRGEDGRLREEPANELLEPELAILERLRSEPRGAASAAADAASTLTWAPLWGPGHRARRPALPPRQDGGEAGERWREQQPAGILVADGLPEGRAQTLAIVANQLSLQLARVTLYQQVESLAVTDALTGLFVRRHFLERAKEEVTRSARHGLSCTVLMADLDHFKEKNDTYGHLVGDVVLRDAAKLLAKNLREVDLIARYGGEEFVLMLIETDVSQALPIAQRLAQLVAVHPIRAYDELLTQTISIGMAAFPDHGTTLQELIERADEALYQAKEQGRNRVVEWTTGSHRG